MGLLLGLPAAIGSPVTTGDVFPVLAASDLGAGIPASAGKVVLVDFWASWCAPCKASFPAYARLQATYAPQGLVIEAISVDQDPAAYGSFRRRFQPEFYVARDAHQSLVSRVGVPTMPTSYLLDRQGRVRFVHPGFHGAETERALAREIETLLAEKAS